MVVGSVTSDRQIVVPIELHCPPSGSLTLDAVVDTGFTGYLTLSRDVIRKLNAKAVGTRHAILGDGSHAELDSYLITVNWQGFRRSIVAIESESEPLLGMTLLWNNRVTFEAVDGGAVSIAPLKT